jgi:hypothetical protein
MGQRISGGFGTVTQIGVKTSRTVKKIGCSNLKSLVENDKIILNDFDLLQEIYRFAAKGDSFEAEEGHDDLVMCCVLFAWLMEQPYVKELSNTDLRRTLYEQNESFIEESLTPFGIYSDGRDEYQENPIQAVSQNNDNWLVDELN